MRIPYPQIHQTILLFAAFFICLQSYSQQVPDTLPARINPQKWSAAAEKRMGRLEANLTRNSENTLSRLQKQEVKVYKRLLATKDSLQAKARLADVQNSYLALQQKIKNPASSVAANNISQYIPSLDSMGSAFQCLEKLGVAGNIKGALSKVQSLNGRFQQADEIKQFMRERRQQLKQQLEQLGMMKELKRINKTVYYYAEQIKTYREILKDAKKVEKKALELLSRTKFFQEFMRKNSLLAALFRLPGDPGDPSSLQNLTGLQTRAQVNNLIQTQIAAAGPTAQAQIQQNIQQAESQLKELKNKLGHIGSGNSTDEMPDFKPNNEKTRPLLKRLEYAVNFQTQQGTNFFPATSDIGFSIGYRSHQNRVIGVGFSGKIGLGKGWNNVALTYSGLSLRSFLDWKLKGSFWITAGYELNYRSEISSFDQLRDFSSFQNSGLAGISKVVSVKSKILKKTKLQLLWDFLSYSQVPRAQPVIYRISYNF